MSIIKSELIHVLYYEKFLKLFAPGSPPFFRKEVRASSSILEEQ